MIEDIVEESSNSPSIVDIENDVYLTEHLADHISFTRHHLTGSPDHLEPPYTPSFYPPTGYWTASEKALFFHALTIHSRLRPDLIAASIGTKSTADVAIYLSLLRQGATRVNNDKSTSSHGATIRIGRDQYPTAHEVSAELITLEDQQAAHICIAEPMHTKEVEAEARAQVLRSVKNGMRVRRGEASKGNKRDREGQLARKEEFERLRAEREIEWARKDELARLDAVALQILDRMLRVDEEEGRLSTIPDPVASSSSPDGPPPSPPPAAATLNDNEGDSGTAPSNLSPASRRLISKRLYMRRKRAEASGRTAQLDPARLKPGRKVSATSKYRPPKLRGDGHGASDGEVPNPKRPMRGGTRPYKIQSEFGRLGIDVDYLHDNGLELFHLGALGRLMRCVSSVWVVQLATDNVCFRLYPRLDASRPEGVTEFIAEETIQTLHALVVQFTRDLVRRAITLRELEFALHSHTKVWHLGERVVRPPHVRQALELCGGAQLSVRMHFGKLVERFSEGEESEDEDSDVPLVVRARTRMANAIASKDEDEDVNTNVDECEQEQEQAGPGKDVQSNEAAWERWSSSHRAIYSPFVNLPDSIAPAHPFGVYAPGTMPEQLGRPAHSCHVASQDDEDGNEEEDLMPTETDEEALEVELKAEERLDAADARAAAAYEAGIWRELRSTYNAGAPLQRSRKRRRSWDGDGVEVGEDGGDGGDDVSPTSGRKRRKNANVDVNDEGVGPLMVIEDSDSVK